MRRHRTDLIVPIRDRRQRRRFLTIRNLGVAAVAVIVLFAAITIRSEMRDKAPGERLWSDTVPEIEQRPVEVVREAAPADRGRDRRRPDDRRRRIAASSTAKTSAPPLLLRSPP